MKLHIEKAIYGGAGLARVEGKAVFVPMTLPGETVEAAIRRDKGNFAEADLLAVLAASPERAAAPCPYYGACGGCQYQHASYPAELAMKRGILLETLERARLQELPELATHAAEPWGYRNRIRLHVDALTHALGYRRRGSASLLPVDVCPIAAPLLQQALAALRAIFAAQQAGAWCAGVELFMDGEGSTLLLSFALGAGVLGDEHQLERLCLAVQEQVPQLRGAGIFRPAAPRASRPARASGRQPRVLADEPDGEAADGAMIASWGEPALRYRVGEHSYAVALGAFFQGNRFLVEQLADLATSGSPGRLAWDLFAGVGLFAQMLASRFEEVVAVEGAPVSAASLKHNLPGHHVVESSTLAFLERARGRASRAAGQVPDRIVLDPPRAGLGMDGSRLLAAVGSAHITYVSCDPSTLARDLVVLVDAGYTISQLHLIDMFPQTAHLETVAMLRLR